MSRLSARAGPESLRPEATSNVAPCQAQTRLSMQEAVNKALDSRASLKAESERVTAARGMKQQAGLLPNNEFQFSNENLRPGQTYTQDVDTLAYFTQSLDILGKRKQRIAVAEGGVNRSQAENTNWPAYKSSIASNLLIGPRAELKKLHAQKSGEILAAVGYEAEMIRRVQELNLKKNFPNDPESRVLEDALCLVFLQYQLAEFANRTEEDKTINALQKSWKKMTEQGRQAALRLAFGPKEKSLIRTRPLGRTFWACTPSPARASE